MKKKKKKITSEERKNILKRVFDRTGHFLSKSIVMLEETRRANGRKDR
jgi:hypothetical protein